MSIKVVRVLSRRDLINEFHKNPAAFKDYGVISINAYAGAFLESNLDGTEKSPLETENIPTGWRLILNFDDISKEDEIAGFKAFDAEIASKIKMFVDQICKEGAERILVHCHAGLSRSPAVAIVIADYLYENNLISTINYRYAIQMLRARAPSPNPYVIKTLRRIMHNL